MTNNADLIAEARDFVQMGSGINIMEADRLIEELSRELEAAERRAALIADSVDVSELDVPYATRLEVIGSMGRVATRHGLEPGVRICVQDGARTVKVFIQEGEET